MAKNSGMLLLGAALLGGLVLASSDSKASAPAGGGGGGTGPKPTLPPGTPPQLQACIDDNMSQAVVNKLAAEAATYMQTGALPAGVSSTTDWAKQLETAGYPKAAACVRQIPAGGGGLPTIPPGIPNPGGIGNGLPSGTKPASTGGIFEKTPTIPATPEEAAAAGQSIFDVLGL